MEAHATLGWPIGSAMVRSKAIFWSFGSIRGPGALPKSSGPYGPRLDKRISSSTHSAGQPVESPLPWKVAQQRSEADGAPAALSLAGATKLWPFLSASSPSAAPYCLDPPEMVIWGIKKTKSWLHGSIKPSQVVHRACNGHIDNSCQKV